MRRYTILVGLVGVCTLSACGSPSDSSPANSETQGQERTIALPADFPADIVLPEDARLVLASTPVPGDVFIEGRSEQSAETIIEGFASRLADAGYVLADRSQTIDPLELYFEGKSVEGGNIRVRDDGGERHFMLTYTKERQ
ncbi:hypothetical protein MB02_10650 [Croceicoccus estronivorus]|uniref:hypothetical protein n=1 Tax=Croceicoccus estronivorus TaxID=1172626 RepID=UPI0008316F1E|nr:hypothetical protein [Croceicoccus estronivorus]OCC23621.1 hypothetical protein MB02_10650 [Croceicoccus estronivorus]